MNNTDSFWVIGTIYKRVAEPYRYHLVGFNEVYAIFKRSDGIEYQIPKSRRIKTMYIAPVV